MDSWDDVEESDDDREWMTERWFDLYYNDEPDEDMWFDIYYGNEDNM